MTTQNVATPPVTKGPGGTRLFDYLNSDLYASPVTGGPNTRDFKPVSELFPDQFSSGEMDATVSLVGGFLQSKNFITGLSGWQITALGNVEFNNGTFRGNLSAVTGTIGGWSVSATSISAANMVLHSSGYIRGGQTAFDDGTGFFLGLDSGEYKFSIGDSDGDKVVFDGTNVRITGAITASAPINLPVYTVANLPDPPGLDGPYAPNAIL